MAGNQDVNYRLKRVYLKFYEIGMAKFIADWRISESKKKNLKERFKEPMDDDHNRDINYLGAMGEVAVAKYLNQYWGGTVNTFHSVADVGIDVEVRASRKMKQDLIVRKNDREDSFYFLVIQLSEETYKIAGFIKGSDAKQEEYYMSPNSRPKAYFVPQSDLYKPTIENLKKFGLLNL